MTEKTEALRLADELEEAAGEYWRFQKSTGYGAAAELRRLHAENETLRARADDVQRWHDQQLDRAEKAEAQRDALLEVLKQIEPILARMYGPQAAELPPMQIVRAAIKAVEEGE